MTIAPEHLLRNWSSEAVPEGSARALLVRIARPYWRLLAAGVGASTGEMCAQLAIPLVLRFLIDDVLGRRRESGLVWAVALLVAAALVSLAARTGARFALAKLAAQIAIDLRDLLARHLRRLAASEAGAQRSGEVMSLFTNDAQVMADFFETVAGSTIVNVMRFLVTLAVLVYLFHGLALIALLLLPAYALLPALLGRRLKRAGDDLQQQRAELSGDLQVSIAATREVKAFGRESWDAARLHTSFVRLLAPYLRLTLFEVFASATFVLFWISAAFIYWVGGRRVLAGTMTVGELLAAISYFTYLDIPISGFVGFNALWQPTLAASERLVRFLAAPVETPDRPGAQPLAGCRGEIAFDQVGFGYAGGPPVLSRISFEVMAGERVAVVGTSGAGKTSLVNLLLRLYEPTTGRVRVDGRDLRDLTASSLRAAVGVAFQDPYFF
ncbi:MAG TPA: ABC transporter ATP-binding protein, partial [Thermoanaerobaculia bacterium]